MSTRSVNGRGDVGGIGRRDELRARGGRELLERSRARSGGAGNGARGIGADFESAGAIALGKQRVAQEERGEPNADERLDGDERSNDGRGTGYSYYCAFSASRRRSGAGGNSRAV